MLIKPVREFHEHSGKQVINLKVDVLARNKYDSNNEPQVFEGRKVLLPEYGKLSRIGKDNNLEKSIGRLKSSRKVYVIEGDQKTRLDADRIEKAGAPAVQINTGSGCHLDAQMIESALKKLDQRRIITLYRKCR